MKVVWIVSVIFAVTTGATAQQGTPSPETLLGRALHQEEVAGDLDAAIVIYKQVIADARAKRSTVATALLHLGICYEKQGSGDAEKAFDRLIREFADQKSIVEQAQTRIAALREAGATKRGSGIVARQIWTGNGVNLQGRPSPDGRLLAFAHWVGDSGNVAIRDLATGDIRQLTHTRRMTEGFAGEIVFSPDGKQLAYTWSIDRDTKSSVRTIGVDGSQPRILVPSSDVYYSVAGWSPDGRYIVAAAPAQDGNSHIALISTTNGAITRLKSTAFQFPFLAGFSPDSRYVAYTLAAQNGEGNGGVFALALDGTHEITLLRDGANNASPAWTPDGRSIVYVSDRSGTNDLWKVNLVETAQSPQLLRANIGVNISGLGFSRDGNYFYGTIRRDTDVYTAGLDDSSFAAGEPKRIGDRFVGSNSSARWSPDSKQLAFLRGGDNVSAVIVIRTVDTGEERLVPVRFQNGIMLRWGVEWFPNGRALLVSEEKKDRRRVFWRVDATTGKADQVFEVAYPRISYGTVAISPDGTAVYHSVGERTARAEVNRLRLVRTNVATGEERDIYTTESPGVGLFGLSVSGDGRYIAFAENLFPVERGRALMVVPADGGTPREVYREDLIDLRPTKTTWSHDNRYIITASTEAAGGGNVRNRLVAFALAGGTPMKSSLTVLAEMTGVDMSPKGGAVAFTTVERRFEVWTLSNVLPSKPSTR